ncbi:hypothetical protein BIV24_28000 [Streptomyces colonosanans]|uniref:Uncharacterized protein n=1 Tax=Streptomyces colonosanans TaxID=1428652 RepID=A0A1S2NW07_9ACTN|nr:hypothetical protein BIV24_28000 [Streptomyces colonosanans]
MLLHAEGPRALGRDCRAFHGAPEEGPLFGTFRIEGLIEHRAVRCEAPFPEIPAGFADLPHLVEGRFCRPVE